ncbi:MAG TPA: radical SAM protein [Thermodesulfobacteriota bacterium]|nr:radical SAM protein [Thermodesulfobacteriota bacterium]
MKESFYIQWHITNFCNLRCRHCYQDDFSRKSDLDWVGLKDVSDNILDALKAWNKTATIHLTGGEPLLKPEIFLLLDYLDQKSAIGELGIITNGLPITPGMIERLSSFAKLKKIKISLDGGDAHVHESIRPNGTFEKVLRNLSLIQKGGRFETLFMFTVMKRNCESLPFLLNLCQKLGVAGLIVERFIPWGKGKEIQEEVLNKEEWKIVTRTLLNFFSGEAGEDPFLPYQAFQVKFDKENPELLGAPCVVGVDGLCIMPEGDVFPCRRLPLSIGNLLVQPLRELWEKSEILRKLRRKENLKGKCGSCEIEGCRGCRSLALSLTGDYLAEDSHCGYLQG